MQNVELACRQLDRLPAPLDTARAGVQLHAGNAQHRRRLAVRAAHQRPQPRGELLHAERLHQVVVGAGVEAFDAVLERVARRQDQHRCAVVPAAPPAQQLQPFEARQAEVEHDRRVLAGLERRVRGDAVAHPVGGEAGLLERDLHAAPEQQVILDEQNAHAVLSVR